MRILVAGGSGAIGKRLVPLLVAKGHQVTATTRTSEKAPALQALGAQAAVVDALNREKTVQVVVDAHPEVVVHQMTALASVRNLRNFDREFELTNRLRTEGTQNLLEGARCAGARMFIAQSYAGWPAGPGSKRITTEDDPFDPSPVQTMARGLAAIQSLESLVTGAQGLTGIVLRYGSLYGPGTSTSSDGEIGRAVQARSFPVVGDGRGIWCFLHVDDAAGVTLAAIERGVPGIFNVVDDEPAEVREWLPGLAERLGVASPRHFPAWLARFVVGAAVVFMMTRARGASNAKARQVLGWKPIYPSWRAGFSKEFSKDAKASGPL